MINFKRAASRIFGTIKGAGHSLTMFDSSGKETTNPEEAMRFFVKSPNYMITLDQDAREIKTHRGPNTRLEDFEVIVERLRDIGREFMLKVSTRLFGKDILPKNYAFQTRLKDAGSLEDMLESLMYGSTKTSYQKINDVRLVVKHHRPVNEEQRGSRSRAIKTIYVESNGERTKFPYRNLQAARAMARHYTHGGTMEDTIGTHLLAITEEMVRLREFVQATKRSGLVNEESARVVEMAHTQYAQLRQSLKRWSGSRSYQEMAEAVIEAGEACELRDDVRDLFTVKQVDQAVEGALPYISRLLNEHEQYLKRLEAASTRPTIISRQKNLTEDELIEYEDPMKNFGGKLRSVLNRCIEENELVTHLRGVTVKIIEGHNIADSDLRLVRNFLNNLKLEN